MLAQVVGLGVALTSCCRSGSDVWDDTKTGYRYMGRGVGAMAGKHGQSRQIYSREDFCCMPGGDDPYLDFIPLEDVNHELPTFAAAREMPGEHGSTVPGIEAFRDPSTIPQLAELFKNIGFEYDSSLVKGEGNLRVIKGIAAYLHDHANTYLFLEGHADERGPDAYNFALGARRANSVRNMLIAEGAHPDQLFTISYGKERPLLMDHHEEAWKQNRRVEFKIYQR